MTRKLLILLFIALISIAFAQNRAEPLRDQLATQMNGTLINCGWQPPDGNPIYCFELWGGVQFNKPMVDLQVSLMNDVTFMSPWLGQSGRELENDARGVRFHGRTYMLMLVESNNPNHTRVIVSLIQN